MRLAPTPLPTAFLAGLLLACAGDQRGSMVDTASAQAATQSPAATSQTVHDSRRTAIVEAVRRVSPSVVSIHVRSRRTVQPETGMFWDFFFAPSGREELVDGFGTGFVLRADGIIATNQHVVAEAEQVTVSFVTAEVRRQTGLNEGDVIIGLNRTPVPSAEDAARLLRSIRPRQAFRLYFERNGQTGYTDLAFP
ncbi:MAG: hypothetical protein AAB075_11510 [Gemmatimonadota bacterium]